MIAAGGGINRLDINNPAYGRWVSGGSQGKANTRNGVVFSMVSGVHLNIERVQQRITLKMNEIVKWRYCP